MSTRSRTAYLRSPAPSDGGESPQRPLALVAVYGGLAAALVPLVSFMLIGVIGWFLTDGGVHGTPRDGLRAGALGWLVAHGSGVHVRGAAVTMIPLALTLLCAVAVWRSAVRVGEGLSDHGPDVHALSDGERDFTVPAGATIFAAAYVVVGVLTGVLAGTGSTQPDVGGVFAWSLLLGGLVGGAGIAVGSGRAVVWLEPVPVILREAVVAAVWLLRLHLVVAAALLLGSLVLDGGAALSVLSQLGTNLPGGILFVLASLLVLPNAVVLSGAYLVGPGFQLGTGTLVSPTVVALGPVPLFPLLAALPDNGPTPPWTPFLVAVPPLVAAYAAVRAIRRRPSIAWETGAARGLSAGVVAGVLFGLLAAVAGGAVGPGRMADVGALVAQVFFSAIVSFGIGGLLGGLLGTWLVRRDPPVAEAVTGRDAALAARAADEEPTVKVPRSETTRGKPGSGR